MTHPRVYIADTECTGTDPAVDQVIELAAMDLPHDIAGFMKAQIDELPMDHRYFSHDVPMQLGALNTHHITADKLAGKPRFEGFANPGGYMIGHNVNFDSDFLSCQGAKRICTLALARYTWPELDSHTQGAILYHIAALTKRPQSWAAALLKNAHSADADVMNCARILKMLIHIHKPVSWEALYQLALEARIPKVMTFGKFKGMPVEQVEKTWADWYAGTETPDEYVILALKMHGIL